MLPPEQRQTAENTLFLPLSLLQFCLPACGWALLRGPYAWSAGTWGGGGAFPAACTHPGCSHCKTDFQIRTERNNIKRSEKRRCQAIEGISSRPVGNELSNRRKDLSVSNFAFLHMCGLLSCHDGGLKDRLQVYQAAGPRNKFTLQCH